MRAFQISRAGRARVPSPLAGEGPAKRGMRGGAGQGPRRAELGGVTSGGEARSAFGAHPLSALSGTFSRKGRRAVLTGARAETT